MDQRGHKDQLVQMDQLDLPDLQDHRGYKDPLGRKDQQVLMVQQDLQGQQDHKDQLDLLVMTVLMEQDRKDHKV